MSEEECLSTVNKPHFLLLNVLMATKQLIIAGNSLSAVKSGNTN